ncbi:OmpA family protein [Ensifer soli]|uniref:OmpA family protein n=1 Tax=Ciceribacter sp. sgz301302 TaxID=3342379 RepID=UPI0035B9B42F
MTIKSRLFATVAIPVFTITSIVPPAAYAAGLDLRSGAYEVAQAGDEEEELLRRQQRIEERRKQREEQRARQGEGGGEQGGGDDAAEQRRQQRIEERRKQREEQRARQGEGNAEQGGGDDAAEQRRQQRIEERRKQREEQRARQGEGNGDQGGGDDAAEQRRQQRIEERRKQREEQRARQGDGNAEQGGGDDAAEQRRQQRIEERRKQREEQRARQGEGNAEQGGGDDAAEQRRQQRIEERRKQREAQQQGEDAGGKAEQAGEARDPDAIRQERRDARIRQRVEERRKRQEAQGNRVNEDGEVVLPVKNGAAVLDSDKRADDREMSAERRAERERRIEERRKRLDARRQQTRDVTPGSDADAQGVIDEDGRIRRRDPVRIGSIISEEGRRIDGRPEYREPDGYRIDRRLDDDREVFRIGPDIWVRGDEDRRLGRGAEETYVERLPRGRVRETIIRPNGVRIITIRNAYGDVVQRSRLERDGREYLLVYSPEADAGRPPAVREIYDDLPPMELEIPVEDYIIDTSSNPDRDYYQFLREPPVEQVERVYSLDEVKYSARVRDKVRRIDLDTITFATGSAEVSKAQAATLRKLSDAILKVLDNDPSETFLIEGHTDAVGSDESNLILSDERAESVAEVLTDVYGVPPENLTTQGYGERYLKVNTQGPEQLNRRVTIRRVTALVKPVASAKQ